MQPPSLRSRPGLAGRPRSARRRPRSRSQRRSRLRLHLSHLAQREPTAVPEGKTAIDAKPLTTLKPKSMSPKKLADQYGQLYVATADGATYHGTAAALFRGETPSPLCPRWTSVDRERYSRS